MCVCVRVCACMHGAVVERYGRVEGVRVGLVGGMCACGEMWDVGDWG